MQNCIPSGARATRASRIRAATVAAIAGPDARPAEVASFPPFRGVRGLARRSTTISCCTTCACRGHATGGGATAAPIIVGACRPGRYPVRRR